MRSIPGRSTSFVLLLVIALVALPLAGCGAGGYLDVGLYVPVGTVWAENLTASFPATAMLDFALWPSYAAPSGDNLLPFTLLPGDSTPVADVDEDWYDADALMSDGFFDYLETWFDVYVPGADDTTFFAY